MVHFYSAAPVHFLSAVDTPSLRLRGSNATLIQSFNKYRDIPHDAPNDALARELSQVAIDANNVAATLNILNVIPADFPTESLIDRCASLAGLKDGTAEMCRNQLELARNRLPAIRREHFLVEDDFTEETDDGEPNFYRGMLLDQQLNLLLASVTTALDEYRVQAEERFDDTVNSPLTKSALDTSGLV